MSIICNAFFMIALSFVILKEYSILQNYHYELNRYLYHIRKNKKNYYYFLYFLLGIFLLKFQFLYLILTSMLVIFLLRDYKLKYTSRVKRVLIINFILLTILLLTNTLKYVFILPFLYLLFVHCLSIRVEKIVYLYYLKKAKKKIKDKYVIGITGSCGKTSVKNIIYDLMINKFNVVKTPKSYNNRVGITKSINEYVDNYCDYFICEYGVDKVKGMDSLLEIVQPNVAIVTEIGNQHLLTFKSIENILKEKMKLVDKIKENGVVIINNDNEMLKNYDYKNKRVVRYGIKKDSDVMAKNIKLKFDCSEFDLYIKNRYITRIKTELLSYHSVENLLCGICTCLVLDMSVEEIVANIKNILPISHRLEHKYIEGIEVIDDSFNSNIKGYLEALDIVNTSSKYKVIITPGIIEQGENSINISEIIAKKIIDKVDYVILVTDNSKYIKQYFDKVKYKNYLIKSNFNEAFAYVKKIEREKIVLIENDLPNIYLN